MAKLKKLVNENQKKIEKTDKIKSFISEIKKEFKLD